MTIDEMRASRKVTLSPMEVSEVLACDPNTIRVTARTKPEMLGFPVIFLGNNTRIPRIPFLRYLGYDVKE